LSVGRPEPDTRRLSHDEIKTLWHFGFDVQGEDRFKCLYRLCFLTGRMRSSAILGAQFSEIDETDGVWVIPADRMKRQGSAKHIHHAIPILDPIREEINKLRVHNQDYKFAKKMYAVDEPRKLIEGNYVRPTYYINEARGRITNKPRAEWKEATGITDLKPSKHIRTSVASELADIKVQPFPIDVIQGSIDEMRSGRRKHYIASKYLELKKETLETWHKHLFKIVA